MASCFAGTLTSFFLVPSSLTQPQPFFSVFGM